MFFLKAAPPFPNEAEAEGGDEGSARIKGEPIYCVFTTIEPLFAVFE
jgi:hypothetical protein